MPGGSDFDELLRRVRAGDPEATDRLVRDHEPMLRRVIRARMRDPRLRRLVDSADVCQTALATVLLRLRLGEFELAGADDLARLLTAVARKKLAKRVRRERADCRDNRRVGAAGVTALPEPDRGAGPAESAAFDELLRRGVALLSEDERRIAELRLERHEWADVAAALGGTAGSLRKQMARAAARVCRELGLGGEA